MSAKPWREVRRTLSPEREARIERRKAEMGLKVVAHNVADLRRHRSRTQAQLAEAIGIAPSTLARNERNPDPRLSTIKASVEAMGGRLQLVAVFDDESVALDL